MLHSPLPHQKMLVIIVGESDRFNEVPLYEAISRKLFQLRAPGVTVQRGIMGFGRHQKRLHHQQLFGISDDRPVTISLVDLEESLRNTIIPAVRPMVRHGLVFLTDVEIIPMAACADPVKADAPPGSPDVHD